MSERGQQTHRETSEVTSRMRAPTGPLVENEHENEHKNKHQNKHEILRYDPLLLHPKPHLVHGKVHHEDHHQVDH